MKKKITKIHIAILEKLIFGTKYAKNDNENTFLLHVEIGREATQIHNELVNAVGEQVLSLCAI